MIKSPCFNCLNRAMGCHSKCEGYADYRTRMDEIKNRRAEAENQVRMVNDCLRGVTRMRLYKGW